MFNKEILRNRLHNGALAAIGTAPIMGLAAYKVLDDLRLDRDMIKIAKFTVVVSIIAGVVWALFPSSRRKPSEMDEEAVKESFGPRILIEISERVQDAEDELLVRRRKERDKERDKWREKDNWDGRNSYPGYSNYTGYSRYREGLSSQSKTFKEGEARVTNPLRTSAFHRKVTGGTVEDLSTDPQEVRRVLLEDD